MTETPTGKRDFPKKVFFSRYGDAWTVHVTHPRFGQISFLGNVTYKRVRKISILERYARDFSPC
jgi:hypothetical protein